MGRRTIACGALLALLTACAPVRLREAAVPPPTPPAAPSSGPASPFESASESPLEFGDAVLNASSSSVSSSPSELPERLAGAILEIGRPSAALTLVLFTHHSCRYCRTFWEERFPALRREFLEPGRLKLQIVPLRLRKYPESDAQARNLLCAAEQGEGSAMHELLFARAAAGITAALPPRAKDLKMDAAAFAACQSAPRTRDALAKLQALADGWEVTLVPTLILVRAQGPGGEIEILDRLVGLPSFADLRGKIERAQGR